MRIKDVVLNKLKNKRGEGDYIELVIGVIVLVATLVFAINVYSFFALKSEMNEMTEQLIDCATLNGSFGAVDDDESGYAIRKAQIQAQYPQYEIEFTEGADKYLNEKTRTVQFGNTMYVQVMIHHQLTGLGVLNNVDIPCTVAKSGISKYHMTEGGSSGGTGGGSGDHSGTIRPNPHAIPEDDIVETTRPYVPPAPTTAPAVSETTTAAPETTTAEITTEEATTTKPTPTSSELALLEKDNHILEQLCTQAKEYYNPKKYGGNYPGSPIFELTQTELPATDSHRSLRVSMTFEYCGRAYNVNFVEPFTPDDPARPRMKSIHHAVSCDVVNEIQIVFTPDQTGAVGRFSLVFNNAVEGEVGNVVLSMDLLYDGVPVKELIAE